jgi:hypothetical protein
MVPIRDKSAQELLDKFKYLMLQDDDYPLTCGLEEELEGHDDWGGGDGDREVKCWFGIFRPEKM